MTHKAADNALAEAIWWLKGFRAAHPDSDPTCGMEDGLRAARDWLSGLAHGRTRLLGLSDHAQGLALTEHEFEVMYDGLRATADDAEREQAIKVIKNVLDAMGAERIEARREPEPWF